MPYDIETFESLSRAQQSEMFETWPGAVETYLIEDHDTYDLHLLARLDEQLIGWAAVRFAPARMTADVSVATGRGSLSHTAYMVDALRVVSDGETSIEWWTRGTSAIAARRVANVNGLPQYRKIIRMERDDALVEPEIRVRAFRADDADDVVRVNNAAFFHHPDQFDMTVEKLHRELARRHASHRDLLLTHVNNELAGFIWTLPRSASHGELHVLAVAPEFQSQGLGGQLIDAGIKHLSNNYNIPGAVLYVDASDKAVIAMYKRHGFADVHTPLISYLV